MNDFDALLKRSFAEAPEPADDGFTLTVTRAVAKRERLLKSQTWAFGLGWAAAGAAVVYGVYAVVGSSGVDLISVAGDQFGAVRASMGEAAPAADSFASSAMQSLSASLTYILLTLGALTGGAVAYRSSQE
ncbi:MAG: hypothetical protein K2P58_03850 [Hyphomonadaceae bacterium]|nr:hypothetical protein [Hyphomonadaceae bacterium]